MKTHEFTRFTTRTARLAQRRSVRARSAMDLQLRAELADSLPAMDQSLLEAVAATVPIREVWRIVQAHRIGA